MMTWKVEDRRALRLALLLALPPIVANCSTLSTPEREAAETAAQMSIVNEQVAPALRLARAARASGDFAGAVGLYRTVVIAGTADPMVTAEFGDVLVDAGAFDEAIGVYSRIDAKSPARLNALLGLSRTYLALSQPERALEAADNARALTPGDPRVLIARGVALDTLGRHVEAQGEYRAVLAQWPRDLAARNNLALSLALSGNFSEALDILMPMARSANASPRVRQNLALVYGLMGDRVRAADASRADLGAAATEANLRFFDAVRNQTR